MASDPRNGNIEPKRSWFGKQSSNAPIGNKDLNTHTLQNQQWVGLISESCSSRKPENVNIRLQYSNNCFPLDQLANKTLEN